MNKEKDKIILFEGLPRQGWFWFAVAIAVSAFIHLISLINIQNIGRKNGPSRVSVHPGKRKVEINIVAKSKNAADDEMHKKIIETPMTPTKAPNESKFLSAQDHATEKERRVSNNFPRPKAADAGSLGPNKTTRKQFEKSTAAARTETNPMKLGDNQLMSDNKSNKLSLTSPNGSVLLGHNRKKPRNIYESLMPRSDEMKTQVAAGYQDFVDENVELGERVDLNTSNFRYLSYFTSIRKALDLVWTYPAEAVQRGLQGEAKVEFTIMRNGNLDRVKVIDGTGHKILDEAVVEAIRLASPFSPLPEGLNKERLTVVGSFRYVLSNYAGAL